VKCRYCGDVYSENVIDLHEDRCPERPKEKELKISDLNAEPAIELANKTDDIDKIIAWLAEESQGKDRKTVIDALETKMKELEGEE
jgi:hypothetical protein